MHTPALRFAISAEPSKLEVDAQFAVSNVLTARTAIHGRANAGLLTPHRMNELRQQQPAPLVVNINRPEVLLAELRHRLCGQRTDGLLLQ